jgi:flavodoxin
MNAIVLYDSKYGNTERVAEAIALTVQEALATRLASVEEIGDCREALQDADLLVIGGPTHKHGMSDPLRATLDCLGERSLDGVRVAVFDTRVHGARIVTGSAAVRLGRLLRRRGAWLVVPAASFIVDGTTGPLHEGELEHARAWALDVLRAVGVRPRDGARTPVAG